MKPKVLLFDLETTPNIGYTWGQFEQNVIEFIEQSYLLSWSAKWLGGKIITKGLVDYPGYPKNPKDDRALVTELHQLIEEADIVVAHNGDRFDIRKFNTRCLEHNLTPPSPYKTVDTLKVARRHFAFNSNRLNDLGQRLGVGQKLKHEGFDTWKGCMQGDRESWRLMKRYNRQDVLLLERVYLKLLPWIQNHPLMSFDEGCRNCGGRNYITTRTYMTRKGQKTRYQCLCGHWS